jgi:hypothetical protein
METLEQLALKLPLPESTASDIAVEATESKAKQKGIFGKILGTFKG